MERKDSISKIKNNLRPMIMVSPLIVCCILLPLLGFLLSLTESLAYVPTLGFVSPSLEAYKTILSDKEFLGNTLLSIYVSVVSTVGATIMGVGLAYTLVRNPKSFISRILKKILEYGMILPYLYVCFIGLLFLTQTGVLSRLLYMVGVIKEFKEFPLMVFDSGGIGIILSFIFKGVPFIGLFTYTIMGAISKEYSQVIQVTGGYDFRSFRSIYLTLSSKTILWASTIFMVYTLGSFEVPYLLGALKIKTLSAMTMTYYLDTDMSQMANTMALQIIILLLSTALIFIYRIILGKVLGVKSVRKGR